MIEKLKYYYKTLVDHYLIEIDYVEAKTPGEIPVSIEKKYIVYGKDESVDYTTSFKDATVFGIVLGGIIVNRLKNENKLFPNLQFALISLNDASFVDTIVSGSEVAFNNMAKTKIDFAADEILEKVLGIPGVWGGGAIRSINAQKGTDIQFIEIQVKDAATEKQVTDIIEKMAGKTMPGYYKEFPYKIIISEQAKAL